MAGPEGIDEALFCNRFCDNSSSGLDVFHLRVEHAADQFLQVVDILLCFGHGQFVLKNLFPHGEGFASTPLLVERPDLNGTGHLHRGTVGRGIGLRHRAIGRITNR